MTDTPTLDRPRAGEPTSGADAGPRDPGSGWTTLHAYVHDHEVSDQVITRVIGPLGRAWQQSGEVSGQFFLRYWDGGPHLRWRLRDPAPGVLEAATAALDEFLVAHPPSGHVDPETFLAGVGQADAGRAADAPWYEHGTVRRVDYTPETDRYGGAAALELAEELFAVSSRVAESVISACGHGGQRVAVAIDLAHAFVAGSGAEDLESARFLRGYVLGWPTAAEAPPVDLDAARTAAERDLLAAPTAHLNRRHVVAGRVADGSGVAGLWGAAVARYVPGLKELDRRDELVIPIPWILASQFHMLHNRLGLGVADECHLAWLASAAYLAVDQTGGVHAGADDAPDRVYHERSKFFPSRGRTQFPDPAAPLQRNAATDPDAIALPAPSADAGGGAELFDTLLHRRSAYGRYSGSLTVDQLSTLLWYAAGEVDELRPPGAGPQDAFPVRTYPSAGARSGSRLFVYAARVDGVPAGLYEFRPGGHALERVEVPTGVPELLRCSPHLDPGGERMIEAEDAPLFIAVVADLAYPRQRYGLRAFRFQLLEAGHLGQNLLLTSTAMGLRSAPLGGVYDDRLSVALGLDGVDDAPLYLLPFGVDGWDGQPGVSR